MPRVIWTLDAVGAWARQDAMTGERVRASKKRTSRPGRFKHQDDDRLNVGKPTCIAPRKMLPLPTVQLVLIPGYHKRIRSTLEKRHAPSRLEWAK